MNDIVLQPNSNEPYQKTSLFENLKKRLHWGNAGASTFSDKKFKKTLKGGSEEKGKIITVIFKDNQGVTIATEKATRADTVDLYKLELDSTKTYLENRLAFLEKSQGRSKTPQGIKQIDAQKHVIQKKLDETNRLIGLHSNTKAKWATSGAPPRAFRLFGLKARQLYVPVLGNLRAQHVINSKNETISRINRSAAVTDFGHGEISLQEMKDYKDLLKLANGELSDAKTEERLIKFYDLALSAEEQRFQYPTDLRLHKSSKLQELNENIRKKLVKSYGNDVLTGKTIDENKLDQMIAQRRSRLTSQVLQDLYVHFENKPPDDSNRIIYTRTALLNTNKDPKVKAKKALLLHERTQAFDMKAIYDELDGKKIFFDPYTKGPFIDERGEIHMPVELNQGKKGAKILSTVFLNISVQGNTKNEGAQQAINEDAIAKLRKLETDVTISEKIGKQFSEILKGLYTEDIKAYDLTDIALDVFSDFSYVSVDCYGGKDRTGLVLANVTHRKLENLISGGKPMTTEGKQLLARLGKELIGKEGLAALVVEDNVGHRIIKLLPYDIELYAPKTPGGCAHRISDYIKAGATLIPGVYSEKIRPDQLYSEKQS